MNKKYTTLFFVCLLSLAMCFNVLAKEGTPTIVSQNVLFVANLQKARAFALNGRYELAREHFLLALAASNDRKNRNMVAEELNSVELMIKTLR